MSLYRIMVVDDEEEIREGIKRKINWESNGFELVASAANGQEALELAESLHPDVVLTDIKMPFMDGLTLGKRLYEQMPKIKLVIFSGFDDFEYAQRAIKINVSEYILKPIDAQELVEVLQKIKQQLDNEFIEKCNIERLREHYQNSIPILREQFLVRLLGGRETSQWISEQIERYKIDISGSFWSVALIESDSSIQSEGQEYAATSRKELIPHVIKQLVDENLSPYTHFKCFLYNDYVAVIAIMEEKGKIVSFINGIDYICKLAQRFLLLTLSAGIGSPCDSLTDLHYSTVGARNALEYRVLVGADKAIYIDDVEPQTMGQLEYCDVDFQDMMVAIKVGESEKIEREVERFINCFREKNFQLSQYQLSLMELTAELLKIIRTYQLDGAAILGKSFDSNFYISSFDSLDALRRWILDTCLKISRLIRQERTNSSKLVAERAKHFIKNNYSDSELSLETICNYLHLSPTYFSTLFKRETGLSFVNYLTQVRMEEAIKLLNTTEHLAGEIANKIGYSEPTYFSYVFKKQFGMSPTKYRSVGGQNGM